MALLLAGLALMVLGGCAAVALGRRPRVSTRIGVAVVVVGGLLGLVPATHALFREPDSLQLAWGVPLGSFHVALDALSAVFLVPVLVLCPLAAVYGAKYLDGRPGLGAHWFFYNLLSASMVMVLVARDGVLFLVAWEVMSLASFFLVCFESHSKAVREAGWTYLVATHLGTAFIIALFLWLGRGAGSLDFDRFREAGSAGLLSANGLFLLAVVGFGTKAGIMPLHVWLPEAHPAAPSHVSAIMSGVMIKTGIYGLVRSFEFLGAPSPGWAWLLVTVGVGSGVLGVLFALAQHDLKRLLAYSSVENIGLITLGLGLGLLGTTSHLPALAALGYGGALVHVVNHGFFKGLLFLGAGAVTHSTGTRDIDRLGGIAKRMPGTALAFLVGSVAISALPPLNGFVSEFLLYLGAYNGTTSGALGNAAPVVASIAGLALIGGLAAACFAKAFGIVFLGEPRTPDAASVHEVDGAMRAPMFILAGACLIIGLGSPAVLRALSGAVSAVSGLAPGAVRAQFDNTGASLRGVSIAAVALIAVVGGLAAFRRWLLARHEIGSTVTWDCGYARPTARMQYSASSFAQPFTDFFAFTLRTRTTASTLEGYFPEKASLATETPDFYRESVYRPAFAALGAAISRLRFLQHGNLHLYVLNIAVVLVALLVWQLA
jgi:hydrogenase-4 component B